MNFQSLLDYLPQNLKTIKLNDLCTDLILFYKKSNKNIKFSSSNLSKVLFIKIDEAQISRVITNLIQNST